MFPRFLAVVLVSSIPALSQTAPSNSYVQHNLVSDLPGTADVTDPNLLNPWGISESSASPMWVSDHDKGVSTLYNGSGAITNIVVTIPPAGGASGTGKPTGQVSTQGIKSWLLANGNAASFIFATEDGAIAAWNTGTTAAIKVDNSSKGAVYTGLAINASATNPMLYAANLNSGNVDVFDGTFAPVTTAGGFADPNLPAGYAPFNIKNLGGVLYVAYAKQDSAKKSEAFGSGNGVVDEFDLNGTFIKRLVSNGGALNAPWGIAIAPSTFGPFASDVLVGNFGDGKINAYDPATGNFAGALQDSSSGKPIVIPGLWEILVGNGKTGGDNNTLYFAAGPGGTDGKIHGLLGSIAPPAAVLTINNGASEISGPIAPGEVVLLNGITIGPSPLSSASLPTTGTVGTTFANTQVTFNGTPAPILFASASETSVVVPYEVAGSATANVVVTYKGTPSATLQVPVAATAPGIFTLNYTGSGAIVALNSDGTLNSATNAAAQGTPVLIYATGEGQTNPPGQNGSITGAFFREPIAKVSLTIGGANASLAYSGSVPGDIAGVMEVEAIVPTLPPGTTGAVPVVLTIGAASSQTTATLFVK